MKTCCITYIITALLALLNNMQGALGNTDSNGDNIFHTSETSQFNKKDRYEWDDDFNNFKNEKQQEKEDTYRDPLWIDYDSDDDNIEILEVNTKYMKAEDEETDNESYYTAHSESEEGSVAEEFEFDSSDSDDDNSSEWEYEMIEQQIGSEDEDEEQVYIKVMDHIRECIQVDFEIPEGRELDFTIFEKPLGNLCSQIRNASDVAE